MKAPFFKSSSIALCMLLIAACSSHPVLPKTEDVKVSRDEASKSCREIGPVTGKTTTVNAPTEEALEDMKKEAVRKGANYIQMETIGAIGGAVRGTAYYCP